MEYNIVAVRKTAGQDDLFYLDATGMWFFCHSGSVLDSAYVYTGIASGKFVVIEQSLPLNRSRPVRRPGIQSRWDIEVGNPVPGRRHGVTMQEWLGGMLAAGWVEAALDGWRRGDPVFFDIKQALEGHH